MSEDRRPTRQEAIDAAGRCLAEGIALADSLPAVEAAKISAGVVSGRFTVEEMTARIEARRAEARRSQGVA